MDVSVQLDEERGEYQLGATVDDVFVPFVCLPKAQVDGHVASVKDWRAAQPQPAETPPASTPASTSAAPAAPWTSGAPGGSA